MKKIINAVVNVLTIVVFVLSILLVTISLTSRNTGITNIGGYTLLSVQTESMEPTINRGDLLVAKLVDQDYDYQIGDVVTFRTYINHQMVLNTHRIVDKNSINGTAYYTTKGDNAITEDQDKLVANDFVASWNGIRIAKAGALMDYLQSQKGFFFCVLLPMIIFFIYCLYQFIKNLIEYNKEKAKEAALKAVNDLTEEQKKKAIEEYLASRNEVQS